MLSLHFLSKSFCRKARAAENVVVRELISKIVMAEVLFRVLQEQMVLKTMILSNPIQTQQHV